MAGGGTLSPNIDAAFDRRPAHAPATVRSGAPRVMAAAIVPLYALISPTTRNRHPLVRNVMHVSHRGDKGLVVH